MKIILENEWNEQVVVQTVTAEPNEAIAADRTHFRLKQAPTNLPGERWDDEHGCTWWRA